MTEINRNENRILVISPRYWPEDVRINDICEGFVKRGYNVDVICGQPNYPSGQFFKGYRSYGHSRERHRGVRIYRHLETKRGSGNGFRIMMNYLVSSFASKRIVSSLKNNTYSAVLNYQTSPVMICSAGLKTGKKRKIPVVTYVVDLWPNSFFREMDMQSPLLRSIFRRISIRNYISSDVIVTRNDRTSEYFVKELHIHPGRVSCIPLGPSAFPEKEHPDPQIMERFYGSFNIVSYDPLLEKQDYDTLFKSSEMIRNTGMIDLKIILVCNKVTEELRRKISKKRLTDIVFVEETETLAERTDFFRIADAFLSCEKTSSGDEYSSPDDIINYMYFGKPVIFAGDGEGRKMIRDAHCGLAGDPEDAKGLFEMIMELYKTPRTERDRMGGYAAIYQQDHYDSGTCIDRLLGLLTRSSEESDDEFIIKSNTTIIRSDDLI